MSMRKTLLVASAASVVADVYMHTPRGSNNRLNEKSANRNNGNRLFDSQNNNRGGYNVGEKTDKTFDDSTQNDDAYPAFSAKDLNQDQYAMMYYEGSTLPIEWTNQHGCGGSDENDPNKLNCNMVVQYMCTSTTANSTALNVELKDGRNTYTPDDENDFDDVADKADENDGNGRGRHENEAWYFECKNTPRNKGLFTADQNLKGNSAIYTRQNPNGARRGLECPEERDYYPYWRPTPWTDVAVITEPSHCKHFVKTAISSCVIPVTNVDLNNDGAEDIYRSENATECTAANGIWKEYVPTKQVPCANAGWSRVNHLGNGENLEPLTYMWSLPTIDELQADANAKIVDDTAKCVLRLRYNISTDDYDPWNTNSSQNDNPRRGVRSPVTQNPTVDVGASLQGLRLAINTAQFGRTFQDRSHTFLVRRRPTDLVPTNAKIVNLGVRGKRGNIVQTFPSVEYDFVPKQLEVGIADYVHIQWTGSNTHNNGNPAGDGQAGDAGEGTGGTDRHNMMTTVGDGTNFPAPVDKFPSMFSSNVSQCNVYSYRGGKKKLADCALYMASSGYYQNADIEGINKLNNLLNNAPASLNHGVMYKAKAGEYKYMNTRNNNFSNRSQRGTINVV